MIDPRAEIQKEDIQDFLDFALKISAQNRKLILNIYNSNFKIEHKIDKSVVTEADKACEGQFRESVIKAFPQMGILGEEFGNENENSDFQWIIDPIDGTAEFATKMNEYGSIIGLYYKNQPLVGVMDLPSFNQRLWASYNNGAYYDGKQIDLKTSSDPSSRIGLASYSNFLRFGDDTEVFRSICKNFPAIRIFNSCYAHACVFSGALDAMVEWNVRLWDLAASEIITEQSNGLYKIQKKYTHGNEEIYCTIFGKTEVVNKLSQVVSAFC